MHTLRIALLSLLVALPAAATPALDPDAYVRGEPVYAYNLAIIPLSTKQAPPYDEYAILEEATAAKSVQVREVHGGGEVNQLRVKNTGKLPLYLLGGEVVLGGQQDRMLQSDLLVEPGQSVPVTVMCVEHGRWSGQDLSFHASGQVAHPELRQKALFDGQGAVWNEVARKSAATGVSSATGTFRRVLQDEATRKRIQGYVDDLAKQLPQSEQLAGFAVAINGDLAVVDVFDSPRLLAKLQRKLLASYVLAALERQPLPEGEVRAKTKAISKKGLSDFMSGGDEGEVVRSKTGTVYKARGKAVHGTFFAKPTSK